VLALFIVVCDAVKLSVVNDRAFVEAARVLVTHLELILSNFGAAQSSGVRLMSVQHTFGSLFSKASVQMTMDFDG